MPSPGLPGVLRWRAAHHPDQVALAVPGVGSLTFAAWEHRSRRVAVGLVDLGMRPGDRVGLIFSAEDWVDYAVACLAVQRAGAVAVPLSDRLAPPQIQYRLTHCGAALAVHGPGTRQRPDLTARLVPLDLVEAPHGPDVVEPDVVEPSLGHRGSDPAQILYTSGTTRAPRAVTATHDNLVAGFRADVRRMPFGHSAALVHAFAIGTNAAQTMLGHALTARPTVLTPTRPTPNRFARLIESAGACTVFLVPSTAIELLRSGALAGRDLTGVQLVGCTAAALPPAVALELANTFPHAAIVNYYTSTEAAPAVASMIFDPARPDCVGRAAPGSLRICDSEARVVPAGTVGDVWLRAPHARSYLDDPDADQATFGGDGWVRMGDLGRLDPDGYLYLVGREDDVVKSGAFKVSTLEVESALFTLPTVADAAVVALPHPVLGAVLGAVVVPRDGATTEITLPAIRGALLGLLSDHELPACLAVVDRLPRNDGGKVVKHELPRLFATTTGP